MNKTFANYHIFSLYYRQIFTEIRCVLSYIDEK